MSTGVLVAAILSAFHFRFHDAVMCYEILQTLCEYGVQEPSLPLTFLGKTLDDDIFESLTPLTVEKGGADTTAVVLNWSRLENVILLTSLLCGKWLDTVIAKVVIWNNNPQVTLTSKTFAKTGCPARKLSIINSDVNLLFQARFMACAQADTPYCFFQDDDYLVQPQVIKNLHSFAKEGSIQSIHLLPPHEHLMSTIRTFYEPEVGLETTFAWLGHGTLANRTSVQQFIDLIGPNEFNLSTEEMKMADNYFTILSNHDRREDLWLDHGIELGGGQPFTVGQAGDDRNDRHIAKALQYLDSACTESGKRITNAYVETNFREAPVERSPHRISHTPCRLTSCVLSTNIDLLPSYYGKARDIDLATVKKRRYDVVNEAHRTRYMDHPLSNAVDGRIGTAFISIEDMKVGDWIALDSIVPIDQQRDHAIEIALLVDNKTARALRHDCSLQSFDPSQKDVMPTKFSCLELLANGDDDEHRINECWSRFQAPARSLKVVFDHSLDGDTKYGQWKVYEIWLRLVPQ